MQSWGGTNRPIEIYKIDTKRVDAHVLEAFGDFSDAEDFELKFPKILSTINASQDAVCKSLEQNNPIRRRQIVGNCSYESTETAIFGVLALDALLQTDLNGSFEEQLAIASSYEKFQALIQHFKLDALESYLERHQNDSATPAATDGIPISHQTLQYIFGSQLEEIEKHKPVLLKKLSACRYSMHRTDAATRKCFKKFGVSTPEWRQQTEERFGELKAVYHKRYDANPELLKIHTAAQRTGFDRALGNS